ncbi:hypothetical protein JFU35_00010 [Bacillus sp. TH45]|nr:hypothetical protein [Bacillus sp. TH45]
MENINTKSKLNIEVEALQEENERLRMEYRLFKKVKGLSSKREEITEHV